LPYSTAEIREIANVAGMRPLALGLRG